MCSRDEREDHLTGKMNGKNKARTASRPWCVTMGEMEQEASTLTMRVKRSGYNCTHEGDQNRAQGGWISSAH